MSSGLHVHEWKPIAVALSGLPWRGMAMDQGCTCGAFRTVKAFRLTRPTQIVPGVPLMHSHDWFPTEVFYSLVPGRGWTMTLACPCGGFRKAKARKVK